MDLRNPLASLEGCDWDEANIRKNWDKHGVRDTECEELFANRPLVVVRDDRHSLTEQRYAALGRTATGRRLYVVFTIRAGRIRVVSARDMSRAERREFNRAEEAEADSHLP